MKAEAASCSVFTSAPSGLPRASSARFSREMLQRRLKKRARAWRVFLAVMQVGGWRGAGGGVRARVCVQARVLLVIIFCICLFICGEDGAGVTFVLFVGVVDLGSTRYQVSFFIRRGFQLLSRFFFFLFKNSGEKNVCKKILVPFECACG